MPHVEDLGILREEIDRIDGEIIGKMAEWVQASRKIVGNNGEPFTAQIHGLTRDSGIDIEGVKRVFQAMAALVEDGRAIL